MKLGLSLQQLHKQNLRILDVNSLSPRDDGPLTDSQNRLQKFQFYERRCSEIVDGLFLGGDLVAKNREQLREHGITHVVNCVGFLYGEYFKDELTYKTVYLQDTPSEDILCVLHDVLEFIDKARSENGRVLVHCSQGVSRSVSMVIAYLMWKSDQPFDEAFQQVKAVRAVASPNIGFTVQLMNWHKRRTQRPHRCRVFRIAPHCTAAPTYLVLKGVQYNSCCNQPTLASLDTRGAFIIQTADTTYIWQGSHCSEEYLEAAKTNVELLSKFEGAPCPAVIVLEGKEPEEVLAALSSDAPAPEDDTPSAAMASSYISPFANESPELPSSSSGNVVDAYTADYNLFSRRSSRVDSESGEGLPPPVRLKPISVAAALREESVHPESPATIEGRMRKYRRSDSERWELSRISRAPSAPYSDWPSTCHAPAKSESLRCRDDSSLS